jgi:arginine-tRNA-protein transferase
MSNLRGAGLIRFDHSTELTCPYLPDRLERQLYTELSGPSARLVFEKLSLAGFRRSHHIVYRPACVGCSACRPVRVIAPEFDLNRSWRRVTRANANLVARDSGLSVSDEQFRLFRKYVVSRHAAGDMAAMTRRDYAAMVLASPVETRMMEFRERDGVLAAACLTDVLPDGLSAVYSMFDPDLARRSLGSYMVLWLIAEARRRGLRHVYLGFWVEGSPKMAYKSRFRPLEAFGPDGWRVLDSGSTRDTTG